MTTEEFATVEIWVLVDQDGDYAAGTDPDTLHEVYDDTVGGDRDTLSMRRVKVTLTIPKPKPVELTGTVPAEPVAGSELQVA
jgi:hypothetical protein